MIAVALPEIAHEFAYPPGTVAQALVASYLVAAIVLQSPSGKLGDRLRHWRILALGQVLAATGAVLGMVASSLSLLAVVRMLMAAGGAAIVPATLALPRIEVDQASEAGSLLVGRFAADTRGLARRACDRLAQPDRERVVAPGPDAESGLGVLEMDLLAL